MIETERPAYPLDIPAAAALVRAYGRSLLDGADLAVGPTYFALMDALTAGEASRTLTAGGVWPRHGVGSLGHGHTPECDALGGEDCNNGQCRRNLEHDRCDTTCTALVVWDRHIGGSWRPDAPNLAHAGPGDLVALVDLIAQGGPRPGDLS